VTSGAEGGGAETALKAENANLKAQIKEQEEEVNRLLGASTEAEQFREEAVKLRDELESSHLAVETLREEVSGQAKVLASIWAQSGEEGQEEEARVLALKEQVTALERENEQLMEKGRKRLKEVKQQRDDLAQKIMDIAESSAERAESAIEEIIGLQKERDETKKVIGSLEKHIGELEEELDAKEEQLEGRKGS
jgi:chromosome segregation ATPase